MTEAFTKIPEEKQKHILNVCIEEFAKNGFHSTSTDVITTKAGISKGILFHYFKNKKNLYMYILKSVTEEFTKLFTEELNKISSLEFFDRIKEATILKYKISMLYPKESELMLKAFINPPSDLEKEINKLYINIASLSQEIYQKQLFNYMKEETLKDGISKEKAIEASIFLLEAYSNRLMQHYKGKEEELLNSMESVIKDLNEYIEIIKYGIYK